jgi:hypothetical protein
MDPAGQRAYFERRAAERRAMDRASFHGNMRDALYATHAARSYAKQGNLIAAWDCLMIASLRRNIAKQYLNPEWPGAWG